MPRRPRLLAMTSGLACCRLPDEAFSKPDSRAQPLRWLGCIGSILRETLDQKSKKRTSGRTVCQPASRGSSDFARVGKREISLPNSGTSGVTQARSGLYFFPDTYHQSLSRRQEEEADPMRACFRCRSHPRAMAAIDPERTFIQPPAEWRVTKYSCRSRRVLTGK